MFHIYGKTQSIIDLLAEKVISIQMEFFSHSLDCRPIGIVKCCEKMSMCVSGGELQKSLNQNRNQNEIHNVHKHVKRESKEERNCLKAVGTFQRDIFDSIIRD